MKKMLFSIVFFLLLLPGLTFAACAENTAAVTEVSELYPDLSLGGGVSLSSDAPDVTAAYNTLYDGLKNYSDFSRNTSISVSVPAGYTEDDMVSLYFNVLFDHPEMFWFSNTRIGYYSYKDESGNLTEFLYFPYYVEEFNTADKLSSAKSQFDSALEKAKAACFPSGGTEMSTVEKILSVHDWIISNCQYDNTIAEALGDNTLTSDQRKEKCAAVTSNVYSAYGVLVDRDAVCQGYALAVNLLLNGEAPQTYMSYSVDSKNAGHMWNIVKVGSSWYNLDATFDDVYPDIPGSVYHDYFLLSDSELLAKQPNRTGYTGRYGFTCSQSYANDKPWSDSTMQFLYRGGQFINVASASSVSSSSTLAVRNVSINEAGTAATSNIVVASGAFAMASAFSPDFSDVYFTSYSNYTNLYKLVIATGKVSSVCGYTAGSTGGVGVYINGDKVCVRQNYTDIASAPLYPLKTTSGGSVSVTYSQGMSPSSLSGTMLGLKNTSGTELAAVCIVAYYSPSGKMIGCETHSLSLAANGTGTVTVTGSSSAAAAKVMVVGSSGGIPCSDTVYYG